MKKVLVGSVLFVVVLLLIPVALNHTVYSEGYRDGVVRKFGTKGLLFKTHEGEMGLDGLSKSVNGVWEFSVTDPEVIQEIQKVPSGAFVRLHYKQYVMGNPFYGSTDYRITKVEKVK